MSDDTAAVTSLVAEVKRLGETNERLARLNRVLIEQGLGAEASVEALSTILARVTAAVKGLGTHDLSENGRRVLVDVLEGPRPKP